MKMNRRIGREMMMLVMAALFTVLMIGNLSDTVSVRKQQKKTISDNSFRAEFFSEDMRKEAKNLSAECKTFLKNVDREAIYFPVAESSVDNSLKISYVNSWGNERTYAGKRTHEGTDIMAAENVRGIYPVLSVCDGTVSNLGWLEKGGYRIGITSDSGTYYYYAHLESYADIRKGDRVKAGALLGYMGDSGYGAEGTVGKFDVHLHFGVYFYRGGEEISVNPYYLLRSLEKKKLRYEFSCNGCAAPIKLCWHRFF